MRSAKSTDSEWNVKAYLTKERNLKTADLWKNYALRITHYELKVFNPNTIHGVIKCQAGYIYAQPL